MLKYYLSKIISNIKLLNNNIKNFFLDWKDFGFNIAFFNFLGDYHFVSFFPLILRQTIARKKFKLNINYLICKYRDFISTYDTKKLKIGRNDKKIRVLWWQGIKDAPDLVKICVDSIKKHNCGYNVIFLDKDNYGDYVKLPNFILEKVKNGKITITHLSDIIRMALLKNYGGIWVDATMYINSNIFEKFNDININSNNYDSGYWKFQKWTGYFIGGKTNILFNFCYDFLIKYHKDFDRLIDYLLIDYAIYIGYISFQECKKDIENINISNHQIHTLTNSFNNVFSQNNYDKLMEIPFSKLTWKVKYQCFKGNKVTIYNKFLGNLGK